MRRLTIAEAPSGLLAVLRFRAAVARAGEESAQRHTKDRATISRTDEQAGDAIEAGRVHRLPPPLRFSGALGYFAVGVCCHPGRPAGYAVDGDRMLPLPCYRSTTQEDVVMARNDDSSPTDDSQDSATSSARGESRRDLLTAGLAAAALAPTGAMAAPSGMAQDATAAQNEAMVRAYIAEVFNGHNLDGLHQYWADEMASHWMGQETLRGLPAWRAGMEGFLTAFPDATYTLDDLFCAGDRGVWRGSWRATQRGVWEGIAPAVRTAQWTVIIMARFAGGKLAEDWVEYDRLGLYRQLGAIPLEG
jgi:predicted ester cyclase